MHNSLGSCFLFKPQGKLILATTKIHEWRLKVDPDVQIEVQKQDIIAQDYIIGKLFLSLFTKFIKRLDKLAKELEKGRSCDIRTVLCKHRRKTAKQGYEAPDDEDAVEGACQERLQHR